MRVALYVRDGAKCVACGKQYGGGPNVLQIHHITPRSEGGSSCLDNLVLLCQKCHTEEHK